jgi:hypothetical protein
LYSSHRYHYFSVIKQCEVMILFNDGASEKESAKFASFLANNDHPVLCTIVYCPTNIGSYHPTTEMGVTTHKM